MYEQWHPLGVIGVITAFNFPVAVWAWNIHRSRDRKYGVVETLAQGAALPAVAIQQLCNRVLEDARISGCLCTLARQIVLNWLSAWFEMNSFR